MANQWAWKKMWSLSQARHSCWQPGSRRLLHLPLEKSALTLVTRWYLMVMGHRFLLSYFLLGFRKVFLQFQWKFYLTSVYSLGKKNPKHVSWRCHLLSVAATASWRRCTLCKPSTKKSTNPPVFLTNKTYDCCKDPLEDQWKREGSITVCDSHNH